LFSARRDARSLYPATGQPDHELRLRGASFDRLYITSASGGDVIEAGQLFEVDAGTRGLPAYRFAGCGFSFAGGALAGESDKESDRCIFLPST